MELGQHRLAADVTVPPQAKGVVIFAHGSGSSRLSPRNRQVAARLNEAGYATILFDLLTEEEALDRRNVFDIELLGRRMGEAVALARREPRLRGLPVGLFGASTGAAAALVAAASPGAAIAAVVSRGGRPDLAPHALARVQAPTLLIVGGEDAPVIGMNEAALRRMRCETRLEIVPGATHLFEEPGTLEQVVNLAVDWFDRHLRSAS
ncbi:MAG: dienelactone hydrolase family protein [Reyranellaceae bacterium]